MDGKFVSLLATALLLGWVSVAIAQDKPSSSAAAVSITAMTPQAFAKLPATAMIAVDGQSMTKAALIARNQSAIKAAAQKMQAWAAQSKAQFQTQRQVFLASQDAKIKAANKMVQAEADRATAAAAAAHGPNWDTNKKKALALLAAAETASGDKQVQLATQAADLLKLTSPQQSPSGAKP